MIHDASQTTLAICNQVLEPLLKKKPKICNRFKFFVTKRISPKYFKFVFDFFFPLIFLDYSVVHCS